MPEIKSYLNNARCSEEKWNRIFNHKSADNQPPIEDVGAKVKSLKNEDGIKGISLVKKNETPLTNEKDSKCKNSTENN